MNGKGQGTKEGVVLVDGTSLNRRMKGVGRYAWHVCVALSRGLPAGAELILVVFTDELPDFPHDFRARVLRRNYHSEVRLGLWEFPRLIRETGATVFVRPADKIGTRYAVPTLTVCHDINPLIWEAQPARYWWRRLIDHLWEGLRGQALRHSTLVVCNSEFVRSAAVRYFGLAPDKTTVGYCGVDRRIREISSAVSVDDFRRRMGVDSYILCFATGDEREGFSILPELWSSARRNGYPGKLIVAGVAEHASYFARLRTGFGLLGEKDSVLFRPFLGQDQVEELACLYHCADFYLETSRHEGFGMQLVEAMSCGTTCFSSGRGALAEIGGGFPLWLDISRPATAGRAVAEAWKSGLHTRQNDAQVLHALSFDWERSASQVVEFAVRHLSGKP